MPLGVVDLTPPESLQRHVMPDAKDAQQIRQPADFEPVGGRVEYLGRSDAELAGGNMRYRENDHQIAVVAGMHGCSHRDGEQALAEAIEGPLAYGEYHHAKAV